LVFAVGRAVTWLGNGRFDVLDHKTDRREAPLDGRINTLQSYMDRCSTSRRWLSPRGPCRIQND
jgi:hypothetical protein